MQQRAHLRAPFCARPLQDHDAHHDALGQLRRVLPLPVLSPFRGQAFLGGIWKLHASEPQNLPQQLLALAPVLARQVPALHDSSSDAQDQAHVLDAAGILERCLQAIMGCSGRNTCCLQASNATVMNAQAGCTHVWSGRDTESAQ